jgi:hypothetical protein
MSHGPAAVPTGSSPNQPKPAPATGMDSSQLYLQSWGLKCIGPALCGRGPYNGRGLFAVHHPATQVRCSSLASWDGNCLYTRLRRTGPQMHWIVVVNGDAACWIQRGGCAKLVCDLRWLFELSYQTSGGVSRADMDSHACWAFAE